MTRKQSVPNDSGQLPMLVAHYHDRPTGAEAWLVVDTFLHGVAGGGIRMAPDVTVNLVKHLAATMSIKLSILEPPCGGAKCGIRYDARAPDSHEVLARVVQAFAPFLQTCWVTGSDLGTEWNDVVTACRERAGIPHPQFALMKAYGGDNAQAFNDGIDRLARGTALVVDDSTGLVLSNAITGWTVCAAAEEALAANGIPLERARIAIQGFGAVGGSAAKFLADAGAQIVAISDELGAILAPRDSALDIEALLKLRTPPARKVVDRGLLQQRFSYELAEREAVLYQPVDVLIPAAGSYIKIDLDRVAARCIVEGANDPFSEEEEEQFFRRGITVIPDAIANCGSAGLYGLLVSGRVPPTREAILDFMREQVRTMTRRILEQHPLPPRWALEEIARQQILAKIDAGHSFLPNGLSTTDFAALESEDLKIHFTPVCPYVRASNHASSPIPTTSAPPRDETF
jgi:glutamate dehydrogenase (NAD(P)+)